MERKRNERKEGKEREKRQGDREGGRGMKERIQENCYKIS